jgi:hypothetical protein
LQSTLCVCCCSYSFHSACSCCMSMLTMLYVGLYSINAVCVAVKWSVLHRCSTHKPAYIRLQCCLASPLSSIRFRAGPCRQSAALLVMQCVFEMYASRAAVFVCIVASCVPWLDCKTADEHMFVTVDAIRHSNVQLSVRIPAQLGKAQGAGRARLRLWQLAACNHYLLTTAAV